MRYAPMAMGKRFGLIGVLLLAGCTNDYDEFSFADSGTAAGGAAGTSSGGASGSGGAAGAAGTGGSSTGGTGGGSACACPPGLSCDNQRCRCTAATQCGQGDAIACNGEGRCVCDGDTCRAGETCRVNGGGPSCSCNGGQDCSGGEICCAAGCVSPWGDEANCGGCGKACAPSQHCVSGKCVG